MTASGGIPRTIARILLSACAGLCACGLQERPPATTTEAEAFVRAHNVLRERLRLPPLQWSAELERLARRRSLRLAERGCRFEHPPLPEDVGENLFRIEREPGLQERSVPVAATPEQVVDVWAAEARDFDDARNRCAPGRQCTHYTQMVWRTTRELGCGAATCPSGGQVWVCDYRPAGNIVGRRPY